MRDVYPGKNTGMLPRCVVMLSGKLKVQLELKLARDAKSNKGFYTGMLVRKVRLKKIYPPDR